MRRAGGIVGLICWLAACGPVGEGALPYWRAVNALDDGRPDIARSELERYLSQEVSGGEYAAQARRAQARSWGIGALQSPGRAEPLWRSLLSEDAQDVEARLGLARCLVQLGRAEEVRDLLEDPTVGQLDEIGNQLLGAALLDLDPERALEFAISETRNSPHAALLAAKATELLGDDEATMEYSRRAARQQPLSSAAYYLLSRSLRRTGDLAGAEAAARRHLDAQSLEAQGGERQGSALERLRALDRLETGLEASPPVARALRLDLLIEAGLRDEGRQALDEAQKDPAAWGANPSELAAWAERLGDLRRAKALLEQALAAEGDLALRRQYQHRLGRIHRALDSGEAGGLLRQALEEQPNVARFHCALGGLAVEEGRADEALVSYERALELAPWRADCRVELARLLHLEGGPGAVEALLEGAPQPAPELRQFGREFGYAVP